MTTKQDKIKCITILTEFEKRFDLYRAGDLKKSIQYRFDANHDLKQIIKTDYDKMIQGISLPVRRIYSFKEGHLSGYKKFVDNSLVDQRWPSSRRTYPTNLKLESLRGR